MSKRIIVCCDGRWSVPDRVERSKVNLSNVAHIAFGVRPRDEAGVAQVVFYDSGAGLDWYDDLIVSSLGRLGSAVRTAYGFVIDQFEPGDQIFLFGFSRGAYIARCTAGLIRTCGVLRPQHRARLLEAYDLYRRRDYPSWPGGTEARAFRGAYAWEDNSRMTFLGVWDTIGPLGLPSVLLSVEQALTTRWAFHDTRLIRSVEHAYQALAIDEQRPQFTPTVWQKHEEDTQQVLEQVWFVGTHLDVGGSRADTGLSAISLLWMKDNAQQCGLAFDQSYFETPRLAPNPLGAIRDSRSGLYTIFAPRPRPIGGGPLTNESIHPSVLERFNADPNYRPANLVTYLERRPAFATAE